MCPTWPVIVQQGRDSLVVGFWIFLKFLVKHTGEERDQKPKIKKKRKETLVPNRKFYSNEFVPLLRDDGY